MGFGGTSEKSSPVFGRTPGSYGTGALTPWAKKMYSDSTRLSTNLENVFNDKSFLDPNFGPQTSNETALLNSIMDLTAGRGAVRGLGAPTQTSLATSIAPTLMELRQQDIANRTSLRGQDIQGLLELIGYAMPQLIGGQTSSGKSSNVSNIADLAKLATLLAA